jgi:5'-methylthioinosine phosphorylase
MTMLAIIGGSGFTQMSSLEVSRREVVRTPYGEPSGALTFGRIGARDVVFLARHGYGHTIPPHEVNYRANIWALHAQGVTNVVSIAAVGGIRGDLKPGVLAIPDQIIDYTHGRASTFFTQDDRGLHHIDFTQPYCAALRVACIAAARNAGIALIDGGVYAATQGPRLETVAEINRLERDGADMVGMTGMPEAVLAKELGLCYAAIAVVANFAAGRGDSAEAVVMDKINAVLQQALANVMRVVEKLATVDGN